MTQNIFIVKNFKTSEEFEAFQKEDAHRIQQMTILPDKSISVIFIEQQKGLNVVLSAADIVRQVFFKNGNLQQATQMQVLVNELLKPDSKTII